MSGYSKDYGNIFITDNVDDNTKFILINNYIKQKIQKDDASYNDFFILGFSLKDNSSGVNSLKKLANFLIENNHKVYYPKDEEKPLSASESKNKIVFSTINQVKGRERKYVIIPYFELIKYSS